MLEDDMQDEHMPEERANQEGVAPPAEAAPVESARAGSAPRRRLSPEQEREVARLYAEASTPTSEIRQRFGIGESSLYRIVQRHGIPLRGRAASRTRPGPPQAPAPVGRRRAAGAGGAQAVRSPASPTAAPTGRPSRGPTRRAAAQPEATAARARPVAAGRAGGRQRFRIAFRGEAVVTAQDLQDALRQVESLGATEIVAVAREA
jgi:transposase-like protein